MSEKKPPVISSVRAQCPVCKQPAYSASGVHPQCMQRSNDLLVTRARAAAIAAAPPEVGDGKVGPAVARRPAG